MLWDATHEGGSLEEWYENGGGGEFNSSNADTSVTASSARMVWSGPGQSGTRLFRWAEPRANRELYFEASMYFPSVPTIGGREGPYWNIFQFKSRSATRNDPFWYIEPTVVNGQLRPNLRWWYEHGLEGPHQGERGWQLYAPLNGATIPTGQWVKFTAFLRQSHQFDGVIRIWMNDVLIHEQTGVRTGWNNCDRNSWCVSQEWSLNNYSSGLSPAPYTLLMDNARIFRR